MRTGDKVIHKTKKVIETYKGNCMIKIGLKWVEGVIYEGDNYLTGMPTTFVRTKEDFEENFEPINPCYERR